MYVQLQNLKVNIIKSVNPLKKKKGKQKLWKNYNHEPTNPLILQMRKLSS